MNKTGIEPVGNRILVKPEVFEREEVTPGGIILTEQIADDEHSKKEWAVQSGKLIAVGDQAWAELYDSKTGKIVSDPWAEPGMRVLFVKYGGNVVSGKDGVHYKLLKDEDVVAVLDTGFSIEAKDKKGN